MAMNTRGFLFTSLALLIVVAVLIIAAANPHGFSRTKSETTRIESMDRYVSNLESDLPRVAYIAGFRSLIGMEEHISLTGMYVSDFDSTFTSLFTNGTVAGTEYEIMENSTFEDFAARFEQLSARQGMRSNLTIVSVRAYHTDPWNVQLNMTSTLLIQDVAGTALFNRTIVTAATVPIVDIKDPIYSIGTQGRAPNTVQQSLLTRPFVQSGNVTTRLQQLLNSSQYIETSLAPSFLMRFSGNFSASPYGIASLVRIEELRAQNLPVDTCRSIVDYEYFGYTDTDPNYYVLNMDEDVFWLSVQSLNEYDASSSAAGERPCL